VNADPYPVTIVPARYGGGYEPGPWLAFPHPPSGLPEGWDGDDIRCAEFWETWTIPVGAGETPNDAYGDLQLKAR
jgi:hypothetical protein